MKSSSAGTNSPLDQDELFVGQTVSKVECDEVIFDFIVAYLNGKDNVPLKEQDMTISKAAKILVASETLGLQVLVEGCNDYFLQHIEQLASQECRKIQLEVNLDIFQKLASKVSNCELEEIYKKDVNKKIVERLYYKKIELMVKDDGNYLQKCLKCESLFSMRHSSKLICPKSDSIVMKKHE